MEIQTNSLTVSIDVFTDSFTLLGCAAVYDTIISELLEVSSPSFGESSVTSSSHVHYQSSHRRVYVKLIWHLHSSSCLIWGHLIVIFTMRTVAVWGKDRHVAYILFATFATMCVVTPTLIGIHLKRTSRTFISIVFVFPKIPTVFNRTTKWIQGGSARTVHSDFWQILQVSGCDLYGDCSLWYKLVFSIVRQFLQLWYKGMKAILTFMVIRALSTCDNFPLCFLSQVHVDFL